MQINNLTIKNQTPKFKGYKNIVSLRLPIDQPAHSAFMSMELNNLKSNDLEKWQIIQKYLLRKKTLTDIITFTTFHNGKNPNLFLNNTILKPESYSNYPALQGLAMKAFTHIASLTKRIMQDNALENDNSKAKVAIEAIDNIAGISSNNPALVNEMVMLAVTLNQAPQENALIINKNIDNIMWDYLF